MHWALIHQKQSFFFTPIQVHRFIDISAEAIIDLTVALLLHLRRGSFMVAYRCISALMRSVCAPKRRFSALSRAISPSEIPGFVAFSSLSICCRIDCKKERKMPIEKIGCLSKMLQFSWLNWKNFTNKMISRTSLKKLPVWKNNYPGPDDFVTWKTKFLNF